MQEANAVALTLMFFWPVADTALAMHRRAARRHKIMNPDYLHMHQFVLRAIRLRTRGRLSRAQANSVSTLVLLPFIAAPVATAVLLLDRPYLAALAWVLFTVLFVASYRIGMAHVRRAARRRRQAGMVNGR